MGDVWAVKRKESVKVAGSGMEFLSTAAGGLNDWGIETMKPWRVFSYEPVITWKFMAVGRSSPDIDRLATGGSSGLPVGLALGGSLAAAAAAVEVLFRFAIVNLLGDCNCRDVEIVLLVDGVSFLLNLSLVGGEGGNVFSPPRFHHVTCPKQQSHASS